MPREFYQEKDLFKDIEQAEKEIATLYSRLPFDFNAQDGSNGMVLSAGSDEAYHNWDQSNARLYEQGAWNPITNPSATTTARTKTSA
ncbi:hypothetical protein MKQ70_13875 [Chitinophaga sedimenti]|uniref:hypothetical protein n=1 Tax=Chitinophaga sedimenti TaxID=2033606 RepID=UPI00200375B1|nr:hypothetical protein [Chitinophaga sedimenti]MCK7556049.1 hypothetical protein [Chitinophaga sedimenti]